MSDNWKTPHVLYKELNELYNFNFDPCPFQHNIDLWDGLIISWKNRNFINPPYSRKLKDAFVKKAIKESKKGKLCVMLLPVSTSSKLFHDFILPNISEPIRFLKGRLQFIGYNSKGEYIEGENFSKDNMIVIFDRRDSCH